MSAWKLLIPALYAKGGGPLLLAQFDDGCGACPLSGMVRAEELGLAHVVRRRYWMLTPLGFDYCEGRARAVEYSYYKRGGALVTRIAPVLMESVPDELIERLLLDSGQIPGQAVRPEVIRAFSAALVAEVRRGA